MSRIIAGSRRGHRLLTPPGDRTRPTSDRVREALFSALAVWAGEGGNADVALAGLAVCDLYAGSGAIGLEAASRGAQPVLLVEADRTTADLIRRNARELRFPVQVRTAKVEALTDGAAPAPFDIVVMDPPYGLAASVVSRVVTALVEHDWLASDGLLVVERAARDPAPDLGIGFSQTWRRDYGETTLFFATRGTEEETE